MHAQVQRQHTYIGLGSQGQQRHTHVQAPLQRTSMGRAAALSTRHSSRVPETMHRTAHRKQRIAAKCLKESTGNSTHQTTHSAGVPGTIASGAHLCGRSLVRGPKRHCSSQRSRHPLSPAIPPPRPRSRCSCARPCSLRPYVRPPRLALPAAHMVLQSRGDACAALPSSQLSRFAERADVRGPLPGLRLSWVGRHGWCSIQRPCVPT